MALLAVLTGVKVVADYMVVHLNADLTSLDLMMCSSMAPLHKSSRICSSQQHLLPDADHGDVSSHLWNHFDYFHYHFFVKLVMTMFVVALIEEFLVVSVRSLIHRNHVEWDQNLLTKWEHLFYFWNRENEKITNRRGNFRSDQSKYPKKTRQTK